jgi:cell wall-associated NlpC family hydrolase
MYILTISFFNKMGMEIGMEQAKIRGKHRLGGRHSDPILARPPHKTPRGAHVRKPIPAQPNHPPTIHIPVVEEPPKPKHVADAIAMPPATTTVHVVYPVVASERERMDAPTNTGLLNIVRTRPRRGRTTIAALATGSVLIIGGGATAFTAANESSTPSPQPRSNSQAMDRVVPKVTPSPALDLETIVAPTEIATPPEPEPVVAVVIEPAPVIVEPVVPLAVVPAPAPTPVEVPEVAAPVVNRSRASIIVSAALGQIGEYQDCVKMVADSLAAVGIYWYKWPVEYYQIGDAVSAADARPGDLIYYVDGGAGVAHIAIYIGNGQAVHGGWNGNETRVWSAYVGSGPQFIRLR